MLVDIPSQRSNQILDVVAALSGGVSGAIAERKGIYRIGHFGSSDWPGPRNQWEHYPEFPDVDTNEGAKYRGCYGVCDTVEQVLALYPELENSERKFVVTLTEIRRAYQDPSGGWRWHKWGDYIGTHDIQHEYLYDEEGIEAVLVYHIYENCPPKTWD
jgi:hypothetical protein